MRAAAWESSAAARSFESYCSSARHKLSANFRGRTPTAAQLVFQRLLTKYE